MMMWPPRKAGSGVVKPQGRLLGLSEESGKPVFAPPGHSLLLSANGGGKTTRGAMPWLFSLLSSDPKSAKLILDSKDGEMAIQVVPMLAKLGVKVAVIDDMDVWPELASYKIDLNPFCAIIETFKSDPRDVLFANENTTKTLIPEPAGGVDKNKHFRDVPQEIQEFAINLLLARDLGMVTPGAVSAILNDPEMLKTFAEIEAREGDLMIKAQANSVLETQSTQNWGQHLTEARRALKLFAPGTRLHEVGKDAQKSHFDLIREGYVIFLVGPQRFINRLGPYYALHIMSFCDALYSRAGALRAICDEFTNTPLKSLVESLTTLRAYGGEIHMIAQSRSEIKRRFGENELLTIEENAIVKLWYGFSSIEEAERVSKSIGDEFALSTALASDNGGLKTNENLSLNRQRRVSAAELMAMPSGRALCHIKGVGYFFLRTLSQANIAPWCDLLADNRLEEGRLPSEHLITLPLPNGGPS